MKYKNTSQAGEPDGVPLQREPSPPHRILVVEDDDEIRRLSAELLVDSGYHVDAAEDGAVAWDALQRNSYDLLVTDNNMPKVSGVELLKKLHAARMALPVIMATGVFPDEEFTRSPWLQPAATLLKPFTAGELLITVKNVLHTTNCVCEQIAPLSNWKTSRQQLVCGYADSTP
jgi:two-component system OmpR family response regulator